MNSVKIAFIFAGIVILLLFLITLLIFFNSGLQKKEKLTIVSVSPVSDETNVSIFRQITIVFSRPLSNEEQELIDISISPEISGKKNWPQDTELTFFPSPHFIINETYAVSISFENQQYSWNFQTTPEENVSSEDRTELQTKADEDFSNRVEKLYLGYPWYENMPLRGENYFVVFDVKQKKFIADLYPIKNGAMDKQIQEFKDQIIARLKTFGIKTEAFQFEWNVDPVIQ